MIKKIAVIKGDGIGPEVVDQALLVLKKIEKKFGHTFMLTEGLIGVSAYQKTGKMLPDETLTLCEDSDAVLFGAIGDPAFDHLRPEESLLRIRRHLGLYCNIRPTFTFPGTLDISPLKKQVITGTDFVVIRELTGGIYYGKRAMTKTHAFDTCEYTQEEILRVTKIAFDMALKRKRKVTLVDKANVLDTSRLWREVVTDYAKMFPQVTFEELYVDNAAMQIIKKPQSFDIILTENMFGDILSDEGSVIVGSLGMMPSASIGRKALYEPIHGSFPKAKGTNSANPVGCILSAAMMLDISFNLSKERDTIYNACAAVLKQGYGTKDIQPKDTLTTSEFTARVIEQIEI